jgi:hypothetical protein
MRPRQSSVLEATHGKTMIIDELNEIVPKVRYGLRIFREGSMTDLFAVLTDHITKVLVPSVANNTLAKDHKSIHSCIVMLCELLDKDGKDEKLSTICTSSRAALKGASKQEAASDLFKIVTTWSGALAELDLVISQLDRCRGAAVGHETAEACCDLRGFIEKAFGDLTIAEWRDNLPAKGLKVLAAIAAIPEVEDIDAKNNQKDNLPMFEKLVKAGRQVLLSHHAFVSGVAASNSFDSRIVNLQDWRAAENPFKTFRAEFEEHGSTMSMHAGNIKKAANQEQPRMVQLFRWNRL